MKIMPLLKDILIYKGPKDHDRFELLEDEEMEIGKAPGEEGEDQSSQSENNADEISKSQGDSKNGNVIKSEDDSKKGQPDKHTDGQKAQADDNKVQGDSQKSGKPISFDEWNSNKSAGSKPSESETQSKKDGRSSDDRTDEKIASDLKTNLEKMKEKLHVPVNQDVVIREFKILQQCKAFIVYIDGMANNTTINDFVLRQLMGYRNQNAGNRDDFSESDIICNSDFILENLLASNQSTKVTEYSKAIQQVLNGLTALFFEGEACSIIIETRGFPSRGVSMPMTEQVVSGPQEAFVENLRINITLVRKIIKSKNLITEIYPIGKVDQINCAIVYMRDIANPKVVDEVKRRILNLDIDIAIGDGVLDQLIEDHPFSLFPQILSTERPDRTASFLLDGKVAIISDGAPFASIAPVTLFHMFHTSEDSTLRWQYATFLRYIRAVASFFAVLLPGLYIGLTLYHKQMIPTELLASLYEARENVPFPSIIEILLMEISFEIIREAGIRVPGLVGQTLGIIGAIVLGQAAVSAGLVSPVLIIIVAITGLGSFAIPNFDLSFAFRIMRFIFIFLGAIAGFYGITAGLFILGSLGVSIKSFGVPFFSPIAPKTKSSPDIINKMPAWLQTQRPDFLNTRDRKRGNEPVRKWASGKEGEAQK